MSKDDPRCTTVCPQWREGECDTFCDPRDWPEPQRIGGQALSVTHPARVRTTGAEAEAVSEIPLRTVTLTLCVPCLAGEGGECHSPGCALWMSTAPDIPITQHLTEAEAEAAHREWDEFFTRTVGVSPSSILKAID